MTDTYLSPSWLQICREIVVHLLSTVSKRQACKYKLKISEYFTFKLNDRKNTKTHPRVRLSLESLTLYA